MSFPKSSFIFTLPENSFPQRLQSLRQQKKFTDITVKVGYQKLVAHRIVLEESVLGKWITKKWFWGQYECKLDERFVSPEIVEDLLDFLYTASITLTTENVYSLTIAAKHLEMTALLEACEKFLSDSLCPLNVINLLLFSDKHQLKILRQGCAQHLNEHCEMIFTHTEMFKDLNEDEMETVILVIDTEKYDQKTKEFIVESVIKWTEMNSAQRMKKLENVLKSFPLSELSKQFLVDNFAQQKVIEESPIFRELVNGAIYKVSMDFSTENLNTMQNCRLYCFGGDHLDFSYTVSCMSVPTGKWQKVGNKTDIKFPFTAAAAIGTKVYLFGGNKTNDMEVFDCWTHTWAKLPSMPERGNYFAVATLNGYVYVTGGEIKTGEMIFSMAVSSVIRYNIQTGRWKTVKSMNYKRYGHQLVELNGCLYAIGGSEDNSEVYNPSTDQWKLIADSNYEYYKFSATSHGGKIYVCSGNHFEVYSPESNSWNKLKAPNEHDDQFVNLGRKLMSVNDKVLAIGGLVNDISTASVFSYDPITDEWTRLPDMDTPRLNHSLFLINLYPNKDFEQQNHNDSQSDENFQDAENSIKKLLEEQLFQDMNKLWRPMVSDSDSEPEEYSDSDEDSNLASLFKGSESSSEGEEAKEGKIKQATCSKNENEKVDHIDRTEIYRNMKNLENCRVYCFGDGTVSCMNVSTGKWQKVADMTRDEGWFRGAANGSKVYLCCENDEQIEVFDCLTHTWKQLTLMPERKGGCAAAVLNGYVYFTGGVTLDGNDLSSSVIRYDIQADCWETVEPMKYKRYGHQLIELNGRLYAIGGRLKNVEEYDPVTDQWTEMAKANYMHCFLGATSHGGKIYACSGSGFEVYSLESNRLKKLTSVHHGCSGPTLVSVDDKLLAIGGDETFEETASVFSYDPTTDEWTQLPDRDIVRHRHCSFVVNF